MLPLQILPIQHVLLADDDKDDCFLFKEAFEELGIPARLTTVHDGEELMQLLNKKEKLPGILFLDLNMPCKNGFICLTEIKQDQELKELPVVILSTSFQQEKVEQLHKEGAQHYVCKPNEFSHLKNLIHRAISKPPEACFVLSNEI